MIKNRFEATNLPDALEYIRMHLETGYVVSAKRTKAKVKATENGWNYFPDKSEYIIVATKEEWDGKADSVSCDI